MRHRVRRGDTLSRIARRYGISIVILIRLNPHLRRRPGRINIGEIIRIR